MKSSVQHFYVLPANKERIKKTNYVKQKVQNKFVLYLLNLSKYVDYSLLS